MAVTRSFFQRIPFIRISSLFIFGTLINHYFPINFHWIGIPLTILIFISIFLWNNNHFSGIKIQNIFISLCIFLSGIFYPDKVKDENLPVFDQKEYFYAEICQKPIEKAKTYQSLLWLQSRLGSKREKVIAWFSKENFDTTLKVGDQLILLIQPQAIKNMGNPFELDYRKMMHNKGIDFSVYLPPGTYKQTGVQIYRLSYYAEGVRDKLIELLAATKIKKEERSVISALTLGYRSDIDPEILDYFINTGTIHVLSVSGLHVALIFFILSFLLSGINKVKFGTIIYSTLMILFLWIYAFITGFSPSVQRSTVMFTFVIIGSVLRRPINIYNSLSASALVLILLDPNVLFDIGFQLSYLAVFGIVLLQPPIESLLQIKNKMLKWGWTLFTVSIAAQVITFPLSILYFNQFANLFWLSNYFAIPGTTLLIWLTFGFFILSPIPFISNLMALLIQFITHLMLNALKWTSALPHAVSEGIVFNHVQVWVIYGLIAAFVIYGFSKSKTGLFGGLILLIALQISALWTKFELFNQKDVYVYNSKNPIIHLINGRRNYIVPVGKYPVTVQEMHRIQNVCNHLKLEKSYFLGQKALNNLKTFDLEINEQSIRFLNCRITFINQLDFNIRGTDLLKFKINNPGLVQKQIINITNSSNNSYFIKNQAFSIYFTSKYKEIVFLNLN